MKTDIELDCADIELEASANRILNAYESGNLKEDTIMDWQELSMMSLSRLFPHSAR